MLGFLVIVLLTLLLPTILLALSSSGWSHSRRRGAPSAPPGNTGWPVIGETLAFLKPHPSTSIGDFLVQRVSRFGNVFTSNLFGQPTVVSADAQFNRFLLLNELKAFEPGWPRSLIKVLGRYTILALVGDDHKYSRSIIVNFLSGARLQTVFLQGVERASTAILGSWKGKGVVSAIEEARKFTFAVIAKAILSMEAGNTETEKLQREFEMFSKGMLSLPLIFPGTAYWNSLKARSNILNVIRQKKEEKINKMRDGRTDVEDDLLTWTLENSNFTEEQTGDLLLGFLFAGHETTAKVVALAIYFLGGCPKALKQMRVNGTLSTHLCVMAAFWAVHMDPSLFEDPEQFNPWRWKDPSGIKKSNNFMAFGGGSRLCPGAELAKLEFVVFFHHLIMNYQWKLVEPDHPFCRPLVEFNGGLQVKIHALES
ncbi:hypothetical protein Taro_015600 [Colocasia esculenta]|uniref:Cytochrome P450 90B1 n=1 Tax=Colocasia esculenta TaxID=4460 RepID=A0A843UQC9_COLES|nr:hypothetical protein [Colocasia esculenta]